MPDQPSSGTAAAVAHACPVCDNDALRPFLRLAGVPILSTEFHADEASARAAARGDLDLAVCEQCSLVWNTAFDPADVDYTPDYENSQHFSPAFQDYVDHLAKRLTAEHGLHGATLVDIGCGKGEFLAILAEVADGQGLGFDPTFNGEVDTERVRVIRRYYDEQTAADIRAAIVMARHVVEHLADPVGFLHGVRRASGSEAAFYYEVPNAEYVFSDDGMWDLIYQHVGYFSQPSLEMALRASGHRITRLEDAFHGQFLGIDAVSADTADRDLPSADAVASVVAEVQTFAERHQSRLARWNELLADTEGEVALWGAGAKGVAFLNLLDDPTAIDHVIDVNPRKAGRFVPGTGQEVLAPHDLAGRSIEQVLIMNPAYEAEIRRELLEQGVATDVATV